MHAEFDDLLGEPSLVPWHNASLVVESFSLNEWARSRYRREKLLRLAAFLDEQLTPGTEVLCIEPGNREAGRLIPALRTELLDRKNTTVLAPCTHHERCPLVRTRDRSWCHFRGDADAPDWLLEVGDSVGLPKERLHVSYLWWRQGQQTDRSRPPGRAKMRVLGEPMRIGRGQEGVYACGRGGRALLSWPGGRIPPPGLVDCGAIFETNVPKDASVDLRSGATVVPIAPDRGDRGASGRRPPRA